MKSREEGKERKAGEKGKRFKRFKITLPLINNYEHYNADACTLAKVKKKVLTIMIPFVAMGGGLRASLKAPGRIFRISRQECRDPHQLQTKLT